MSKLNDAMVEAVAKVLCCGSVCNASGTPGDQCTASKFFGEKAHQAITAALALQPEAERAKIIEECAKVAEQEVETYNEGMSAIDVRLSYSHGPKWKDGRAIAAAIRALALPAPPPAEGGQKG